MSSVRGRRAPSRLCLSRARFGSDGAEGRRDEAVDGDIYDAYERERDRTTTEVRLGLTGGRAGRRGAAARESACGTPAHSASGFFVFRFSRHSFVGPFLVCAFEIALAKKKDATKKFAWFSLRFFLPEKGKSFFRNFQPSNFREIFFGFVTLRSVIIAFLRASPPKFWKNRPRPLRSFSLSLVECSTIMCDQKNRDFRCAIIRCNFKIRSRKF